MWRQKMFKKWKLATALLSANIICAAPVMAAPMTFNFTIDNFTDACPEIDLDLGPNIGICTSDEDNSAVNTITGTFTGEDKNNDGYISSFIFARPDEMQGSGFEAGEAFNEVTSASFTLSGPFTEGVPGFLDDPVTSYTVSHDLTDVTDTSDSGFLLDFFFLLNFDLTAGGVLGDGEFESMFMGVGDQTIYYALGQFLPSQVPGFTITEGLLNNNNPAPCLDGNSCAVLHSLSPTLSVPSVQRTSSLAMVSQVSAPATLWLFAGCFVGLALLFNKHSKLPGSM